MAFPAGHNTYTVTINVFGHRHGGSGASFWFSLAGSTYDSYYKYGRGAQLGPELGGVHPWFADFTTGHFGNPIVLTVTGNGGAAQFNILSYVNDAQSQVFWCVHAQTP